MPSRFKIPLPPYMFLHGTSYTIGITTQGLSFIIIHLIFYSTPTRALFKWSMPKASVVGPENIPFKNIHVSCVIQTPEFVTKVKVKYLGLFFVGFYRLY